MGTSGGSRRIVREYARDDQFITTCIDPMRSAVHDGTLSQVVDLVATNQYLATQSELSGDGSATTPSRRRGAGRRSSRPTAGTECGRSDS